MADDESESGQIREGTPAKTVRDNLGLEAGSTLVVEKVIEGILMKPLRSDSYLVKRDGVLVFVGTPTDDVFDTTKKAPHSTYSVRAE